VSRSPLAWVLLGLLTAYRRLVSPVLLARSGPRCRFEPSCSSYAEQAVREHGAVRGGALALRRLSRCHPWGPVGDDPVPPRRRPRHASPHQLPAGQE
jgi:putative membrane protein insertion efficiency factor